MQVVLPLLVLLASASVLLASVLPASVLPVWVLLVSVLRVSASVLRSVPVLPA